MSVGGDGSFVKGIFVDWEGFSAGCWVRDVDGFEGLAAGQESVE